MNPYEAPQAIEPGRAPEPWPWATYLTLLVGCTAAWSCFYMYVNEKSWVWVAGMVLSTLWTGGMCQRVDERYVYRHAKWANEREYLGK